MGHWPPGSECDGVGFSGGSEVMDQGERVGVGQDRFVGVGDWQVETGALHQAGQVAQFGEWRYSGRGAAGQGCFGFGEGGSQGCEGAEDGEACQQEAAGAERHAELDEGAGEVVDPVQRQVGNDEVEGCGSEGEAFFVGGDGGAAVEGGHSRGEVAGHGFDTAGAEEGGDDAAATDVERVVEGCGGVVEAVQQVFCGISQHILHPGDCGCCAVAVEANGVAIEDDGHELEMTLHGAFDQLSCVGLGFGQPTGEQP